MKKLRLFIAFISFCCLGALSAYAMKTTQRDMSATRGAPLCDCHVINGGYGVTIIEITTGCPICIEVACNFVPYLD